MSINVYLRGDEVKKIQGFELRDRRSKDGQVWKEYSVPGLGLSWDKGRWFFYLHELTDPIPEVVKGLVEEITVQEVFPTHPSRVAGVYRLGDVEAVLDKPISDNCYSLKMRGKSMENMLKLCRTIRAGTVLPDESWEREQLRTNIPPSTEPINNRLKQLTWRQKLTQWRRWVRTLFSRL